MKNTWSRFSQAFTIVELFVVAAIILILVTILSPGSVPERESTHSVSGLGRFKQLGLASTHDLRLRTGAGPPERGSAFSGGKTST